MQLSSDPAHEDVGINLPVHILYGCKSLCFGIGGSTVRTAHSGIDATRAGSCAAVQDV